MKFSEYLQNFWWKSNKKKHQFCLFDLLLPLLFLLQYLFILVAKCRKILIVKFWQSKCSIPVIVVGNLSVGGAGKTPLTLCLAQQLLQKGFKVGIISRGYGRQIDSKNPVLQVLPTSNPQQVGDETLLMSQRLPNIPIFVAKQRLLAAKQLLADFPQTQIIISDDGLQHYQLFRNAEIIVFDERGIGNGNCLPFGPLRENLCRLNDNKIAAIICNINTNYQQTNDFFTHLKMQFESQIPLLEMHIFANNFYNLYFPNQIISATELLKLKTTSKIYAIVGMGNPQKFFDTLFVLGFSDTQIHKIIFKDHHNYQCNDFAFLNLNNDIVLMSEKDAVKCRFLQWKSLPKYFFVLPISASVPSSLTDIILEKINQI